MKLTAQSDDKLLFFSLHHEQPTDYPMSCSILDNHYWATPCQLLIYPEYTGCLYYSWLCEEGRKDCGINQINVNYFPQ